MPGPRALKLVGPRTLRLAIIGTAAGLPVWWVGWKGLARKARSGGH